MSRRRRSRRSRTRGGAGWWWCRRSRPWGRRRCWGGGGAGGGGGGGPRGGGGGGRRGGGGGCPPGSGRARLRNAEFASLFDELCNWGRWGTEDERGTLNLITPERVAAAAGLVHEGRTVTMSRPLDTRSSLANPVPADHHMTMLGDAAGGADPLQ